MNVNVFVCAQVHTQAHTCVPVHMEGQYGEPPSIAFHLLLSFVCICVCELKFANKC